MAVLADWPTVAGAQRSVSCSSAWVVFSTKHTTSVGATLDICIVNEQHTAVVHMQYFLLN